MKLLIIEDDLELATSLKRGLELASYAVDSVNDGEVGLRYALSGEYDVAIVDWMLPGMDGLNLCQRVRQSSVQLALILLTAKGTTENRIAGLDAGADDYLVKPFAFAELLARLRAVTRRPAQTLSPVLEVGSLRLDTISRVAYRDQMEIALSAREYALLELLMRQPKKVFSREELAERAWNEEATILSETVETYISYLRAKIDKPFSNPPLIKTVWGQGYKIQS